MSDSLEELLRQCHRTELLPLAEVLKIKPEGMALDVLARALSSRVRQRGAHIVANAVVRKGEGPPWTALVRGVARRQNILLSGDPKRAELEVLAWWMGEHWSKIGTPHRKQLWTLMEMEGTPPEEGKAALVEARRQHPKDHEYLTTRLGIKALMFAFIPGGGCLMAWFWGRPRDDLLVRAILKVAQLRQALMHRVTVGVVGSPSSGKDAAIAAIFGFSQGNINPVAGSTTTVEITRLPQSTELFVVNTPGMGDIVEAVTERAREVLDLIDVYVYVVNAQGGVQAREKADYDRCVASGRPVLAVVNKIDTLRPADRERYLADAREKLGASESSFLAAAFDPLPQLSETPIGLDEVQDWLTQQLVALGKSPSELPWHHA